MPCVVGSDLPEGPPKKPQGDRFEVAVRLHLKWGPTKRSRKSLKISLWEPEA